MLVSFKVEFDKVTLLFVKLISIIIFYDRVTGSVEIATHGGHGSQSLGPKRPESTTFSSSRSHY